MRSRFLFTALPMLCSGALLLACSSPAPRPQAAASVSSAADDLYLRGRNLHLERRYDEALAAYQAALRAEPGHVNARNGLAIAYAERREFDKAIPIWHALTQGATMASGTGTAYLFANLGYAQFLQGDYQEAVVALEKACLLDPLNARAWQYLGESLQRLGQDERAQLMLRQASALRGHDLHADYVAVGGATQSPAIEQAVHARRSADRSGERGWAFVDIVGKEGGVLEMRRTAAGRIGAPMPASTPVPTPAIVAALEIANGNGRQGLARLLARQLQLPDLKVVRLSNEKGFGVRQTRIEYQPEHRAQAERLAARLGAGKPVETRLARHADLRLVIGRDLSPQRIAALPASQPGAGGGRGGRRGFGGSVGFTTVAGDRRIR